MMAAIAWNGSGVIKQLWVYPDYVVFQQGPPGTGPAGCKANDRLSFRWSDFDPDAAARTYSTLLAAYTAKLPVNVTVSSIGCGPEGHKEFKGQISLLPH